MSVDACYVDPGQLSTDELYTKVLECARGVYRELLKDVSYRVVNRVLSSLASKIATTTPYYKIVETPRRIEFMSQIDKHRYAPLPVLVLTSPFTETGYDLPIRYDTIPSVIIDARLVSAKYTDALHELIQRAQKYIVIIRWSDGTESTMPLELKTDISLTISFAGWSYEMSYDKDYPPTDPPVIYFEGFLYKVGDKEAEGWEIDMIECNVLAYQTTSGEYYSGYGGLAIYVYNSNGIINRVKVAGHELSVSTYKEFIVAFSNVFSLRAYILL